MKRILLFFFLILVTFSGFSQIGGDELPRSWIYNINTRQTPIELPPLDLSNVIIEDSISDLDKSLPWRYGIVRPLEIDPERDGVWTDLTHGGRIWKVAIKSPNAINISINFENFRLPEGSLMHMYNDDGSDVSKAYSKRQNTPNNQKASWYIEGDIIWLEYYEPENVTEDVQLQIGSIIHGYRMGRVSRYVEGTRGLNDSGACNYDVNCTIGSDFDSKKDVLKKTVALLTLGNGYLCSASLVNNTAGDKRPYLLTANHCLENSDPSFWTVRFNWMSPNPICGTGDDSSDLQTNFTMSGAAVRANNPVSDFALVELYNDVPGTWDIAFAGWDNSDIEPTYEVGIHHPNGDIMKICRDDSGAVKENANGIDVWLIGGVSVGSGDGWEIGTTESGSSGSPLFDQNGRIIGQLYAGQSECDGLINNNDYDIYGRFGVSWDTGESSTTRLRDWLDPQNTGISAIESLQNILSIPDNSLAGNLNVYPNPATYQIMVMNTRYPNLSYQFFNAVGQQLMSGSASSSINELNVEAFAEGVYFLTLLDGESNSSITKKIVIRR